MNKMHTNNQLHFAARDDLASTLSKVIAAQLRCAIALRDKASLIVSGGSSPIEMFKLLSQEPLDWEKVHISLADERWLDASNHDTNAYLLHKYLLINRASDAAFWPLIDKNKTLQSTCTFINKNVPFISEQFDVVVLGMGNDGHTASLFPCAPAKQLSHALSSADYCSAIEPSLANYQRITLTAKRLLSSQKIYLLITGEEKSITLDKALSGTSIPSMPIRQFVQQTKTPVDIFWAL
jgi:6-phosphogluconolactonase